jgi:hypothetical protein
VDDADKLLEEQQKVEQRNSHDGQPQKN